MNKLKNNSNTDIFQTMTMPPTKNQFYKNLKALAKKKSKIVVC